MKLNAKLFLLTFSIITIVSVFSAYIYLTLAQNLLKSQQSKALVNSANDFIFSLQTLQEGMDNEFREYQNYKEDIELYKNIDLVFRADQDSNIVKESIIAKDNIKVYKEVLDVREFLNYNSNLILRQVSNQNDNIYYGIQINNKRINYLSQKIRAEIALVERDVVSLFTNSDENQYYLPHLSRITRELKNKNNFELVIETIDDVDFSATHYSPRSSVITSNGVDFIIFNISNEAADFRNTMSFVTAIIVISGILLSIIFLLVFTAKFRQQLESISNGVKKIADGVMNERVEVISSDEIGKLGIAFNAMLDEIEKRDNEEKEYSEFIALINQNPSLEKIGNATLQKIMNSTKIDAGALYLYEEDELKQFAVYGLQQKAKNIFNESSFYKKAKEKGELVEIVFDNNHPIIKTGITELKINYLYVMPIFHNNEIIAIMELASVNKPQIDVRYYLNKIKDQLAIGLANGKALLSLQSLVEELKTLNKAYQKQNIEITNKNDELLKLHSELKNRTEELEVQSQKAIESEKVKSQFLANMSHELRTPQNAILGLTEVILKDESTSPETQKKLNVILRNGKKLLNLIENILEYSKLESGNKEIQTNSFWLDNFIQEVSAFVSPLFFESHIDFIVDSPDENNYEIKTDEKKLEQIVYNLIGNAVKFTTDGYVKLKININNNDLILTVEDTGPGIIEEDHKIIFEEFRQADGNLNRRFSGSGLGLAICNKYTKLLGGKISLKSKLGKGSIFTVTLPSAIAAKRERQNIVSSIPIAETNFTALILSESSDSIDLISDYLKGYDIQTINHSNLKIDLSEIENYKADIIILDILSSKDRGWKLLSNIKSSNKLSNFPVVVVNMDGEANCGLGLNIYQYIYGKLSKRLLYKVVDDLEESQSIKFRRILFVMNDNDYDDLENELIQDELKYFNWNGKSDLLEYVKSIDPDLIVMDIFCDNINVFNLIAGLNEDLYAKCIPVIAFLDDSIQQTLIEKINNNLLETTLQCQYHPLDVLKVIKDRIELMDSSIFIKDENITIPEKLSHQTNSADRQSENGKIQVLIVDDDTDARFTIGEIVNSLGYDSYFASDGFDCLDKIKKNTPDLVLLDIMMPKMDGFQTIKKIRENEKLKSLKVYALTAYAMLSDKGIIERNGFDGLITKPINTVQLERKLNQIFKMAVK